MSEILQKFVAWTRLKVRIHVNEERKVFFQERDIWWASLGQNIGYEQNGKNETFERPVLVLKKFNLDLMWILPLTSNEKKNSFHFSIEYKEKKSSVILSQIRTISSRRLLRKIRMLPENEFYKIRRKVRKFL